MSTIWFWQRIVSPHMAGLAVAMARLGCNVTYVAEEPMSADRAQQGWTLPELPDVRLVYVANPGDVQPLVDAAPLNSVHICQGIRGNGLVALAQRALARRSLRQWVVMETVDDATWSGALKRLEYRRLFMQKREQMLGVLAIGHRTSSWVVARGVPPEVVYPFAYFLPDAAPPPPGRQRGPGPFRFLFAGRLIPLKRIDWLITALACLADQAFELWVLGAGPEDSALCALAGRTLGDRARFLGQLPLPEVPAVMAQADCLVLPSVHDGWGAVVSEALMAGTPVICSDACGAAGVVLASGCGGVFPSADLTSLKRLLVQALDKGPVSAGQRLSLVGWAKCLGGDAGADYLLRILDHADGQLPTSTRPLPPWSMATTARRIEVRDGE